MSSRTIGRLASSEPRPVGAGYPPRSGLVGYTIPQNPKAIDFHLNDIARLQPEGRVSPCANAAGRTRCYNSPGSRRVNDEQYSI
jgi:hypothetical protein